MMRMIVFAVLAISLPAGMSKGDQAKIIKAGVSVPSGAKIVIQYK